MAHVNKSFFFLLLPHTVTVSISRGWQIQWDWYGTVGLFIANQWALWNV